MSGLVIFLNGPINSGKNEAALYLSSRYGFSQYAFGDKIREGLYALNPYVNVDNHTETPFCEYHPLASLVDHLGWDYCKRNVPEVRRLLQVYGTEAGRDIHGEHTWTNVVANKVLNSNGNAVISDLRFPSEFTAFDNHIHGRYILHITKPDVVNSEVHVSESMDVGALFPGYVIELVNDGSIEDLHKKIDALLFQLVFNRLGVRYSDGLVCD